MALRHGSEAKAKASPPIAAATATVGRCRSTASCPMIRTTSPAASAMQTPERRFMRQATPPNGSRWVQAQPISVYSGKPVGWKIDRV